MKISDQIYCPIRKDWKKALPEEVVRQKTISWLVDKLGFPLSCIAVEQRLEQMPHLSLSNIQFPNRRADIVCFGKGIHPNHALYPLLLIECKAVKITPRVINQVTGYNHYLQAYFIAAVNQEEVCMGWIDPNTKQYSFIDHLPSYDDLIKAIKS